LSSTSGILVFGASGHAKVILDIIEQQGCYNVIGLIDSFKDPGTQLMDYSIIGREDCVPELVATGKVAGGIVAVGHNWLRKTLVQRIREIVPDFVFVNAIHPSARIARTVALGNGVAVMAGVSINPGTRISDFCFLNTNASVDHDNILGDFSCLQPNAATGGNVKIGSCAAISMGAHIIHGVTIGCNAVVGAGSTVLSDIPDLVVAYGTPCRVVRSRNPADGYY